MSAGWVPKCLVGAFGDNGDIYCRKCVEADREIQKRLELPHEDEFSLKIIADDDADGMCGATGEASELAETGREWIPLWTVQGIRCMQCEVQIPEFPPHLRAMKGLT